MNGKNILQLSFTWKTKANGFQIKISLLKNGYNSKHKYESVFFFLEDFHKKWKFKSHVKSTAHLINTGQKVKSEKFKNFNEPQKEQNLSSIPRMS